MKILKILGIVIAVLIVVAMALPFVINVNSFRPKIESELSTALGREVKIGNLRLSVLTGSVSADDLSISDDPAFSQSPFVRARSLGIGVEVMPLLFSKTLHVTNLTIDQPQVTLLRSPSGKWNFSGLGGKQEAQPATKEQSVQPDLSVGKLQIKKGEVSIGETKAPQKLHTYKNVDVTVKDFSLRSKFPFTLATELPGGGTAKLDGAAGPINNTDTALTPLEANINVKQLNIAASGLVEPSSGYAGVADFDGKITSDGHNAKSSGTANVNNLKLSPKGSPSSRPVQLKYAVDHNLVDQTGRLTQGDVNMGGALAHLTGSYRMQEAATLLNMRLDARNMAVNDLVAMLPALGVVLPSGSSLQGGTLTTDLGISGAANNPTITGPIRLENTKLAGFNLGSKLASSALAGVNSGQDTSIQNLSTDVHVAPAGIQTQNVNLNIPALGLLTGNGTISPAGALDYKLTASINSGVVSGLSQLAGFKGTSASIPFIVQGTTSNPRLLPDIKGLLGSQLKGQLANQLKQRLQPGQTDQNQGDNGNVVNAITGLFGKKKK